MIWCAFVFVANANDTGPGLCGCKGLSDHCHGFSHVVTCLQMSNWIQVSLDNFDACRDAYRSTLLQQAADFTMRFDTTHSSMPHSLMQLRLPGADLDALAAKFESTPACCADGARSRSILLLGKPCRGSLALGPLGEIMGNVGACSYFQR